MQELAVCRWYISPNFKFTVFRLVTWNQSWWESETSKCCKSGPFSQENWFWGICQHTTAPKLKENGVTGLAQIQVLFIYVGGMIHNLDLQVMRPIFPASVWRNSKNGKKSPESDFSHFSCFNLIRKTQYARHIFGCWCGFFGFFLNLYPVYYYHKGPRLIILWIAHFVWHTCVLE